MEQDNIKIILTQQLKSKEFQHSYLFVGGAGTGKTTCARIFADEINNHEGNPIELDAASNSSVDDVRNIIQQAKIQSLDSEYKVFIIDECHSLSNTAWQAFLKLIEEPPAKSIFIFATTNPEKIPKTIISRVQRFDFQRISQDGIVDRLHVILEQEEYRFKDMIVDEAIDYIAKIADGGMRDAITLLDKCLSYSPDLTTENVVNALGVSNYSIMMKLTNDIIHSIHAEIIDTIERIHADGQDLHQFIRQYINFVLDVKKWFITSSFDYLNLPHTKEIEDWLDMIDAYDDSWDKISSLLETLIKLNADIKYDSYPKSMIEAVLLKEGD